MASIDDQISRKLKEIDRAQEETNKFSACTVGSPQEKVKLFDIYEAGLAYDTLNLKTTEFHLLLAEKYPTKFSRGSIEYLNREKRRLKTRISFWKKREFPRIK